MSDVRSLISDELRAVEEEVPELTDRDLRTLYEAMTLSRTLDRRCRALHRDGRIGFYLTGAGLEALDVGYAWALDDEDWLFPGVRQAAAFLLRGGSLQGWLDQLFGNENDELRGRQLPGHPSLADGRFVSPGSPTGPRLVQAAGCAMAIRQGGDRRVVGATCGEANVVRGDFHDAVGLAGGRNLPLIFVVRRRRRPELSGRGHTGELSQRARAHGLSAVEVDGDDVLAVYASVRDARTRALDGGGATLIEARCRALDPVGEETGGGDVETHLGDADPILRYRGHLQGRGLWDAAWEEDLDARNRERVEAAAERAEAAGPPPPESLLEDVASIRDWRLEERRELWGDGGSPGADEEDG